MHFNIHSSKIEFHAFIYPFFKHNKAKKKIKFHAFIYAFFKNNKTKIKSEFHALFKTNKIKKN